MPTMISICPYCRKGGVRAPNTALGASATCPKCKSSFTLLPEDDLPDWAANAKPESKSFYSSPPELRKSTSSPLDETNATSAMPDITEPSPVLPAEPPPSSQQAATSQQPVMAAPTAYEAPSPPDKGLVVALLSLILIGPAVLASQLPYGRASALVLVVLGLATGLFALLRKGKPRQLGGLGIVLHVFAGILLLFLPSWLGLHEWRIAQPEEPHSPVALEHGTGRTEPLPSDGWIEASKYSWQYKGARVSVRGIIGPVELSGPKDTKQMTKESYLQLMVRIRNVGLEHAIELSGWSAGKGMDGVSVSDEKGIRLKPAAFDGGWETRHDKPSTRIIPWETSDVVLTFSSPPRDTEQVLLQLPGEALGISEVIRFRVKLTETVPSIPVK